jgi:hypothetical protein
MFNTASFQMSLPNTVTQSTQRFPDIDVFNALLKHANRLREGVERVAHEEEKIRNNRTLSDEGKRQALVARVTEHLESLDWFARGA